jgi:hypothetical protein
MLSSQDVRCDALHYQTRTSSPRLISIRPEAVVYKSWKYEVVRIFNPCLGKAINNLLAEMSYFKQAFGALPPLLVDDRVVCQGTPLETRALRLT